MAPPLIQLEGIRRVFRVGEIEVAALAEISMTIERGELVALTGASGSGKTTLMNLLGLLDRPSAGEYWLNGHATSGLSSDERAGVRSQQIGFVFQTFNLLPRASALEQVMMPLAYACPEVSDKEGRERAIEQLRRVGLDDRVHHKPAQLSGGQQQRVAIARALINRPSLLLADEPTGNLDSRTSQEVISMLRSLNQDEGITIVVVTHDPGVAAQTRRIVRLMDGRVVSDKSPESPGRASVSTLRPVSAAVAHVNIGDKGTRRSGAIAASTALVG